MQETMPKDMEHASPEDINREYFEGKDTNELVGKMNDRLAQLEGDGQVLVKRTFNITKADKKKKKLRKISKQSRKKNRG